MCWRWTMTFLVSSYSPVPLILPARPIPQREGVEALVERASLGLACHRPADLGQPGSAGTPHEDPSSRPPRGHSPGHPHCGILGVLLVACPARGRAEAFLLSAAPPGSRCLSWPRARRERCRDLAHLYPPVLLPCPETHLAAVICSWRRRPASRGVAQALLARADCHGPGRDGAAFLMLSTATDKPAGSRPSTKGHGYQRDNEFCQLQAPLSLCLRPLPWPGPGYYSAGAWR